MIGSNRDEGRTFRQTHRVEGSRLHEMGQPEVRRKADKILAQYPWPKDADEYAGAYLAGAIITDAA